MQKTVIEFNQELRGANMTEFAAGEVVKVYRKIKEGDKERIQIFEGIIIAVKGGQSSSPTITVRKVSNGIGVELIIPIFSPSVEKIEKVKSAKIRRAKLYYLRGLTAKKSRMKYTDAEAIVPEEQIEAPVSEEIVADAAVTEEGPADVETPVEVAPVEVVAKDVKPEEKEVKEAKEVKKA
jgi:large subunit ribosomal protein L19